MVPVDAVAREVDRDPARQISRLRIGFGIGFEQHRLLVEAADPHADDRLAVTMVIIPELRELLAGHEEGRLTVRHPFLGFGKFQRGFAYLGQRIGHLRTNSFRTLGYSACSAASTRCSSISGVSPLSIATSAWPSTSPASSSSVTMCTEQPLAGSPASIARACVSRPRYLGSREGWMLMMRPAHFSTNQGERMRMKPASAIVPTSACSSAALSVRS